MKDLRDILIKFQEFQLEKGLLKTRFTDASENDEGFSKAAQMFIDSEKPIENQPKMLRPDIDFI